MGRLRLLPVLVALSICVGCSPSAAPEMEKMVDAYMEGLDRQAQALWKEGRLGEVEALYVQMAAHRPQHADSHFNIGLVRTSMGDLDGAIAALDTALRLPAGMPHHSFYYQQLGMVKCKKAERSNDHVLWDEGLRGLTRAVQADPLNVNAWATAATNYMALGHERTAMRATEAATRLGTARGEALSALGVNYARVGRVRDAIRLFKQALALDPKLHRTRSELLHSACAVADWVGYDETLGQAIAHTERQVRDGELTHLQPFDALAHRVDSGLALLIAASYARDAAANAAFPGATAWRHPLPSAALRPGGQERLHIAYVSADWTARSAVGRALRGGIAAHRRDKVLVSCYSLRNQRAMGDGAEKRAALLAVAERVHELDQATDWESARRINEDGVHVLINLNGYTNSARNEVFALSPAPVQVLVQGFAGTMGAEYIHYNLLDPVQAPPEHARFYSEKLMLLPVSAFRGEGSGLEDVLQGERKREARRALGIPEDRFVAANLNRPFKLEPRIFETWMGFLRRTAGVETLFWMFRWPEALAAEANLRRSAGAEVSKRVVFTDLLPLEMRIQGKGVADLFLDSPEYNAHGTATEVLSGGVPVLTLPLGKAHASRVASSVVLGLGMGQLVARTYSDYQDMAVRLATQPRSMAKLCATLQARRRGSDLFNASLWAVRVETAFFQAWELRVEGLAPHHTVVAAAVR